MVKVTIHLLSMNNKSYSLDWAVHEFPVFFDLKTPCNSAELGKSLFHSAKPEMMLNPFERSTFEFETSELKLRGSKTIWGRSIYLKSTNNDNIRACTNIRSLETPKTAVATFTTTVAGQIIFRQNEHGETLIFSNLFYASDNYKHSTKNEWRVMVTDILDSSISASQCHKLHILLDPDNTQDTDCGPDKLDQCKMGDMTKKFGSITVGSINNRYSKKCYLDTNFSFQYLESNRQIFVAIIEKNDIIACAQVNTVKPKSAKAHFDMDGVKGYFVFNQDYRLDPTIMTISLNHLRGRGKYYQVLEFPFSQRLTKEDNICSNESIGELYNPFNVDTNMTSGQGSKDQYAIGDLSGKHGILDESQDVQSYFNSHIDFNLPLFGTHSIIGRSIAIHKANGERWVCANIAYIEETETVQTVFHYPVVGKIVFRQEKDNPFAETMVFGQLEHSDTTQNTTSNHIWRIHVNEAGRDFYNWTRRCESCGDVYNPFAVSASKGYSSQCSRDNQLRCLVSDLYLKYGKLTISSALSPRKVKFFYTDTLLPLSGQVSCSVWSLVKLKSMFLCLIVFNSWTVHGD